MDQLYKMARDCLERGQDIIRTARKEQRPLALFRMATPSPTVSPTLLNHPQGPPSHHPHPLHPGPSPSSSSSSHHPQYARNAPQNLGIRTGHAHPHQEAMASRNMSWPSSRRVPGTRSLPRGLEGTDGVPGGHVRGAGQQLNRSQPNRSVHVLYRGVESMPLCT